MIRRVVLVAGLLSVPGIAAAQVVGGAPAAEGAWPDAAAVYFGNSAGCTGVLVAPRVVLTAGHCIGGISKVKVNANSLLDDGEEIAVVQQFEYPNSWQTYDIGVLILERDSVVPPRLIAHGCARDKYIVDGAEVAIVGYGAIDQNASQFTNDLMEARSTIFDAQCTNFAKGCNSSVSPGGELGAGGGGIDSCNGDSGGPLYLVTERGDFLVGITSRATDDATTLCGGGGIYGRPDAIIQWIEQQTGADLAEPVCNFAPEPTAPAIEVVAGETGTAAVAPNDGDAGDGHSFAITAPPMYGEAAVMPDGTVEYTADLDYAGTDQLTVTVTDDGDPALSGTVVIAITVTEAPEGGCACRAGGATGGAQAWLLAMAVGLMISRRRRFTA